MPRDGTVRKALLLPAELAQRVDDFRFEKRFRSDAEALRALVEAGLGAESRESNDERYDHNGHAFAAREGV